MSSPGSASAVASRQAAVLGSATARPLQPLRSHEPSGRDRHLLGAGSPHQNPYSPKGGRRQNHSSRKAGSAFPAAEARAGRSPGGFSTATAPGPGRNQGRGYREAAGHSSGNSPPPLETRPAFTGMQSRSVLKSL